LAQVGLALENTAFGIVFGNCRLAIGDRRSSADEQLRATAARQPFSLEEANDGADRADVDS
jgi:hypothetical protein